MAILIIPVAIFIPHPQETPAHLQQQANLHPVTPHFLKFQEVNQHKTNLSPGKRERDLEKCHAKIYLAPRSVQKTVIPRSPTLPGSVVDQHPAHAAKRYDTPASAMGEH